MFYVILNNQCTILSLSFRANIPSEKRNSNRERDDSRLTRLMLLIFVCFLFCFLPLMLVNVFDDKTKFPVLNVLASVLAWASSVINPFIYAASNRQYRTAYSKLFNIIRSSADSLHFSGNSARTRAAVDKTGHSMTSKQNSNVQT